MSDRPLLEHALYTRQDDVHRLLARSPGFLDEWQAEVRKVLDVPHSATLLGSTQALLEGGKVAFERPVPDEGLLRSLWALLPASTRKDLWPASFAFGNALGFDVLVVPRIDPALYGS